MRFGGGIANDESIFRRAPGALASLDHDCTVGRETTFAAQHGKLRQRGVCKVAIGSGSVGGVEVQRHWGRVRSTNAGFYTSESTFAGAVVTSLPRRLDVVRALDVHS